MPSIEPGSSAPSSAADAPAADLPDDHYILQLAIEFEHDGDSVIGRAPVRSESFVPGSSTIRSGILLTLVDLIAGHTPNGATGPTIDLHLEMFSPPPTSGFVQARCRPLRVGSRLIVAETELHAPGSDEPFANCLSTFMNNRIIPALPRHARPAPVLGAATFDDYLGLHFEGPGRSVLAPARRLLNGPMGTIQGGVQGLMAEITAEHLLGSGRPMAARDLDIRYLSHVKVGPLAAVADGAVRPDGTARATVRLVDAGNDDRLVSFVTMILTPV
jgi:acyl-coenzyme A thioesterase PaaI-like protein